MYPIQQEYGLELIKSLVDDKNLSRIYGFILYTREDPYVVKVLRDEDFWDALDEISGPNWPVFAVKPLEKGYYKTQGPSTSGVMSFMIHTWDEPRANTRILADFGLSSSKELPCFVAFMWDDNNDLNSITVPICGNDIDSVYYSIENIVRIIKETEEIISPEYKHNVEVFRNVSDQLNALKFKHKFKKSVRIGRQFIEFLKNFL